MSVRRSVVAALVPVLAAVLAGAGTDAATAQTTPPPARGGVVIPTAAQPTLTAIGRTGLVATATRADGTLVARAASVRKGVPTWGRKVALGRIDRRYAPQVALNQRGVGAVAWNPKAEAGSSTLVRLRSASGAWSKAYRIPNSAAPVYGAAVNQRGTVAVVSYSDGTNYPAVLAIHRPGEGWQTKRLTDFAYGPATVAVAADGSVYLGGVSPQLGANGSRGYVARVSPEGRWSRTMLADNRVESLQVLATPDGHVDLVLGQAQTEADQWESTTDRWDYWATHYVVRSRLGAKGPWKTLWDQDGVVAPQAVLEGNEVRLTWTQYADPTPGPADDEGTVYGLLPRRLELRTTEIGASTSDPDGTLLTSETTGLPTDYGRPTIAASTAAAGRCLVVAWRTENSAGASPLSSSFGGSTRTWPDAGRVTTYDPEAATACVAGHGFLARTAGQKVRGGYAVSGKVRVESLG
jgi:hypothetical protein